jgi:putative ABC transport system permease protein
VAIEGVRRAAGQARQDARFALRFLMNDRWFAAVAIAALALGIGVNNTLFTIVNAYCIRGLPIDRPDRVVSIGLRDAGDRDRGVSPADFEDIRTSVSAFSGVAAFSTTAVAVRAEGRPAERFTSAYVSASALALLGKKTVIGRDFLAEDHRDGAPAVTIVSYAVWINRFGGERSFVGRSVHVNGAPVTVIGVMEPGFRFPNNADLWQPLAALPGLSPQRRDMLVLSLVGRLADGVGIPQARSEVDAIAARLAHDHPGTNDGVRARVIPVNERYNGRISDPAWIAFMTVGALVVIIACANVANLLLMRSTGRAREIGIRASLGATRQRLLRQLFVESAVLAAAGGLVGLALSVIGVRLLTAMVPDAAVPPGGFGMDVRVFAVLAAVCLGTVFLFGLTPALHMSRTDVNAALKEGRPGTGNLRVRRWTAVFLTAEFGLTLMLMTEVRGSLESFLETSRADRVIDTSHLLTMWLSLPAQKYGAPEERLAFYRRLEERVATIAPISSAAITTALPFGGATPRRVALEGRAPATREQLPEIWTLAVGTHYFETLDVPLARGRGFTVEDGTPGHESVIVNQLFADRHFPGADAVGRRIQLVGDDRAPSPSSWLTIVGVSRTIRQRPPVEPDPVAYLPFAQNAPATAAILLRGRGEPGALAPLIREEVRALDADLPIYRMMTMDEAIRESRWNPRVANTIITSIALIALCLSAVGLYTVTAHGVAQRRHEIGIRMALGANRRQVSWLVLRRAMAQLAAGLAAGLVFTLIWERLFSGGSRIMSTPAVMAPVAMLLVVVALVACLAPIARATRLDPSVALRYE